MNLKIKNIDKHFKSKNVLSRVNLNLKNGDICHLGGANGSGKTTFLKILSTIITPDNGSIVLNGIDSLNNNYKKNISWITEKNDGLFSRLSGVENINFFASLLNVSQQKLNIKIDQWEQQIPIFSEILRTKFYQNSTGMRQLLSYFCKTLHDPNFIILDEPFKALDKQNKENFVSLLKKNHENKIIIYSSHQEEDNDLFCNKNIKLLRGKIVS